MEVPQLTDDQQHYLQAIFDYLDEHGMWPTFKEIDHQLDRAARIDAVAVAKSLSPLLFGGQYSPWSQRNEQTRLPLRIVSWCTGSERLLELVVATVQLAAKKEQEENDPTVTSDELMNKWNIPADDVRKLGALLVGEMSIWSGADGPSAGFRGPEESGAWSMGIGRDIRQYRDVRSIEQLVAALPPLPPVPPQPTGSVIAALNRSQIRSDGVQPPVEISESLARFRRDHPEPSKTAFIMMRFASTAAHEQITSAIKETLQSKGLVGLRADDSEYHSDLYWNIVTCMHGCGLGIAVFERIETNDFNPNVALEVGYMLALGKDVCFLKDQTLPVLNADLLGKLYRNFDTQHIKRAISPGLSKWLKDKGHVPA